MIPWDIRLMSRERSDHNYFHNLELDLSIDPDDFSVFRNTYAQNNIFYGTARGTGNVRITGPPDNISISAKAKTGGGTQVYIPISSAADVGQNDYIIFKKPGKDTIHNEEFFPSTTPAGLSLSLAIMVNPEADVGVLLPNQMGIIKATGTGNLTMGMTPTTGFSLSGTYIAQKGSFHFQMKNLMQLSFTIEDGSRISWSGDPADANISMTAIYRTRVALGDMAMATSINESATQRIPVECVIRLSGQLSNPSISFGLNLPNVDQTVKSDVYSKIDTSNALEMTQQIFSILVLNQFKSYKGSSVGSVDVSTTSMSIIMSQFTSLLSKLSKDVDIGVNYRPTSSVAGKEIDVAVSTQLLNDRLLIDGLFGVNSMSPTATVQNSALTVQKANTIIGDIKIEYFLTKNRRWTIRTFNRTNTVDILYNNAPYTQGVGLSYQRDFDHWIDFFKSDKIKNRLKE